MSGDLPDPSDRDATERWFLRRGLPHLIEGYSASRDVLSRAAPFLTLVFLAETLLALDSDLAWWANALALGAGSAALVLGWAVVNRLRRRRAFARPDRFGIVECAVFVLVPPLLPLVAGDQRGQVILTLTGNLVLLGASYLVLSYGIVPMGHWASRMVARQLGGTVRLLSRALPLLLLFVVFLFLSAEIWDVAGRLTGPYLVLVPGLFGGAGMVFAVTRLPREVSALAPADAPPLGRRQWFNVGLVVLLSQFFQALIVSGLFGGFLTTFGLLALTPETIAGWARQPAHEIFDFVLWGRRIALTEELLRVVAVLTGFTALYFLVAALTDPTYREEFLEEVMEDLREAFTVRTAYLAALHHPDP